MTPKPVAVFDLDGTLVDTAPDLSASLDHCLASVGLAPVGLARIRPHAGRGAQAMLRLGYEWSATEFAPAVLGAQTARFLAHYEANIAVASRFYDGALGAMDRLEAAGFVLAVCTNKPERLARLLIDALGVGGRFAAICGADTFSARKPDPVHLLGTIARAGGDRHRALMIGDTRTDLDAARAADVPCVLMDFGEVDLSAEDVGRADLVLSAFADLDAAALRERVEAGSRLASDAARDVPAFREAAE